MPKIDLSFGPTETKDSGAFSSFSGWGGSTWNTGSNWNFSGADTTTTDIADSFSRATKESTNDATDSSAWSFGGNKKNQKKTTTTSGFDFGNFGALEEERDEDNKGVQVEGKGVWGAFPAAGKVDKKSKKKGAFEDASSDPDPNAIGTALADPQPAAEDSLKTWGAASTKKKKGKKGEEEMPLAPTPAAAAHVPADPAADEWGGFGIKKGGKKGKKITEIDEPIVTTVPEPEPEGDAGWGSFSKKEKKKGKKENDFLEEPATSMVPEPNPETEAVWGTIGKKERKKGGKKEPERIEVSQLPGMPDPEPDPALDLDFGYNAISKKDDKKGKKLKKEPEKFEEPMTTSLAEPEPDLNFGVGAWDKKDDKKSKKGKDELEKSEEPTVTAFTDAEPDLGFSFGSLGKKDDKKGKKGKKDDKIEVPALTVVPEPEPEVDIGWGSFAKKEVKKKGNKVEELSAKQPDPEPVNEWESPSTKKDKDKDKKKVKNSNFWDEPEHEDHQGVDEEPDPEVDTGWAFSPKTEKKKGKKAAAEEIRPIQPEPVVEEKSSLLRTGSTKGKKGKKGLVSDVKEDPVPAIEPKSAADAASVVGEDDGASGFGTDKKKDKKNKRNSLASTGSKGDEVPTLPPPVPEVPDASSFDIWSTAKKDKDKDKKGKKGKVNEPETIPVPKPEETKDTVEDDLASWAGLTVKERKKKEREREREREKKDREAKEVREMEEAEEEERKDREKAEEMAREEAEEKEREEKEKEKKEKDKSKGKTGKKGKMSTSPETSKTKDLLADSIPDFIPVAGEDSWGSTWGAGAAKNDKKKGGRKEMLWGAPPPAPTPPAQGLTPEPEDFEEDVQDDNWGEFPSTKTTVKAKKDGKRDTKDDVKGVKKGIKDYSIEEVVDDTSKKSGKDKLMKKDSSKEETAAKAGKNAWGGVVGITSASKSKMSGKDKDKAVKEAKEKDEAEAKKEEEEDYDDYDDDDDADDDELIMQMVNEEAASKKTANFKDGNLWKTGTNDSDKASKGSSGGKKKGFTDDVSEKVTGKGKIGNGNDDEKKNDDSFNLWSSSLKKTPGKKTDDIFGKKEITAKDLTNQKFTGKKGISNEPELMEKEKEKDDQSSSLQPSKPFKSAMSTVKSTKISSVAQRVKELEKENNKPSNFPPPDPDPEPTSNLNKKPGPAVKARDLASHKTPVSKSKDLSPQSKIKDKLSKPEVVPGSFPGEGMDDDFNNLDEFLDDEPPLEKKDTKKSAKSTKDSTFTSKTRDTPESKRPATPPPETKEEKPAKKERPRIAKGGGAASWGLWSAAPPKKETKAKDDIGVPSPPKKEKAAAPGFSRSKSTRTAKEKDKETVKSETKSSDSDKPKKTESRPPKSRSSSFGGLFGGGPPTRTKSVRKNSTAASVSKSATSRKQSMDVDATSLPSPPAEEAPKMTSKAAKMMGTAKLDRKASTRGKQKAFGKEIPTTVRKTLETADGGNADVPDPYAIDSDDMVMVNGMDNPLVNGKRSSAAQDKGPKSKPKGMDAEPSSSPKRDLLDRTKSKRDPKFEPSSSKRKSKTVNDFDDDVVMVDAASSGDGNVEPGPDDMQFITKPKILQRSATTSKKPDGKSGGLGGGLFGAFRKNRRASEMNELPKTRAIVEDEEVAPRKRTVTGGDDSAKRPRRDDRRKTEKTSRAAEGYVYDTAADIGGTTEPESADARREKRRARRAEDDRLAKEQREEALKYEADRRAKRREADKAKVKDDRDRRARKDEEVEARRVDDKEDRRAAREARRREEEENRALEEDILKPRSKRRETEKEVPAASSSRPRTSDRRRSHMDKPTDRPKSSRQKSTMAPVDDYFDARNGRPINENDPYGGNDHTTSWVKSQVSEPPEPPPVEPTIMEQAPDFRAKGADDLMEDEYARRASHKKPKRGSRMYTDPLADEQEERRRRRKEKEIRSSEGSAAEERYGGLGSMNRRPSDLGGVKLGAGTKTFDGKTGQGKRSSWFQKVTGVF